MIPVGRPRTTGRAFGVAGSVDPSAIRRASGDHAVVAAVREPRYRLLRRELRSGGRRSTSVSGSHGGTGSHWSVGQGCPANRSARIRVSVPANVPSGRKTWWTMLGDVAVPSMMSCTPGLPGGEQW